MKIIEELQQYTHKKTLKKPACQLSEINSDFELIISDQGKEVKSRKEAGFEWLWKCNSILSNQSKK